MAAEFLRAAREARGLSLSEIAAQTRISPTILQRLERGQFDGVPAGLYVRSYLKAYARAVGLDPEETVRVLDSHLPRAVDSFTEIVQTAVTRQPAPSARPKITEPPNGARAKKLPAVARASLKMSLGRQPATPSRGRLFLAASADAALLVVGNSTLVYLCALACGVSPLGLLQVAAPGMALLCGTVSIAYFTLLGGIAGQTCGARMLGVSLLSAPAGPIDLESVCRRTWLCLIREACSLVGLGHWSPNQAGTGPPPGIPERRARPRPKATLTPFPDRMRSA